MTTFQEHWLFFFSGSGFEKKKKKQFENENWGKTADEVNLDKPVFVKVNQINCKYWDSNAI